MSAPRKRTMRTRMRGLTLVELLVVVMVVTLLSAVTLPTLRTIMTQRKTSQASILVKNMLEAARARAIARGRPVAVVLERLSSRATRDATGTLIPEVASTTDLLGNFALYNTCIRMSFAETPPPVVFENVTFTLSGNSLTLSGGTLAGDSRFRQCVKPGALIDFPSVPAMHRPLRVVAVDYTTFVINVDNPPANPSLIPNYVNNLVLTRQAIRPTIHQSGTLPNVTMSVHMLPQPIASQVVDLPKGTCVDLSLSGYASDTRWSSSVSSVQEIINFRDSRRHFASDWVWPSVGVNPGDQPSVAELRPIYIVFGSNGILESVFMNDTKINTSNGEPTGDPFVAKYDVHDDLFLFVGRTDQILRMNALPNNNMLTVFGDGADGTPVNPEDLDSLKLKANINDSTAQWVRISPRSGAISVATVASAYETPFNGVMPTATSFPSPGELIGRSRSLSFTDEATAQ